MDNLIYSAILNINTKGYTTTSKWVITVTIWRLQFHVLISAGKCDVIDFALPSHHHHFYTKNPIQMTCILTNIRDPLVPCSCDLVVCDSWWPTEHCMKAWCGDKQWRPTEHCIRAWYGDLQWRPNEYCMKAWCGDFMGGRHLQWWSVFPVRILVHAWYGNTDTGHLV